MVLETVLSDVEKLSETTSRPRNAATNLGIMRMPRENETPKMIPQHQMMYCADVELLVTMMGMMMAPTMTALYT